MTVIVPKLKVPFEIRGGGAAVVEQDSVDEIVQCVDYLLQTEPGTRLEVPEFGLPDPTFEEHRLPDQLPELIREAIGRWEPRADLVLDADHIDDLTEQVRVRIGGVL